MMVTQPIRRLLQKCLLGKAGIGELTLLDAEAVRGLPQDHRDVLDLILADAAENGVVDAGRIYEKANGSSAALGGILSDLVGEDFPPAGDPPQQLPGQDPTPEESPPGELILDPANPMDTARRFVESEFVRQGNRILHHQAGEFFRWTGSCYPPCPEEEVRAGLYGFLEKAKRRQGEQAVEYKPNRARVGDALDALRAVVTLPGSVCAPAWLDNPAAFAKGFLSCRNGILYLPTGDLLPHTPKFFVRHALPTEYRTDASPPTGWHAFLRDLWPKDEEAIAALQDLFGYCLDSDTRQQKIFLIVGPKRSGKGTIARILTGLLGQDNVAGPTLASLGSNFGLAPLIGKPLAVIADARLGGRADQYAIAERLLSVSGEDAITIDRKFLPAWTGRLPTRFILLTNELPRIADASGALASRFIVMTLTESFLGREDPGLTSRLLGELPGIFAWALEGWRRLRRRGYFLQPESSREAVAQLEDLSSPVAAFVRERCDTGEGHEVECQRLYDAWKKWCEEYGRDHAGTLHTFGRDLRATVPELKITQHRAADSRRRYYLGLRLLADWELARAGTRE
jgi:putative DNA primase/helicase